jgi:hypothetical protein
MFSDMYSVPIVADLLELIHVKVNFSKSFIYRFIGEYCCRIIIFKLDPPYRNIVVPYRHGGGWSRKINAWYLNTLMVYL